MNCETCINYVDVAGLYKDAPRGLCMIPDRPPKPVDPTDGLNCPDWRPGEGGLVDYTAGDAKKAAPSTTYPISPKPISLEQRKKEDAIVINDILKISLKGEWLVSAIGKTAILATNPQTNMERAFPADGYQFERLRK